MAAYINNKEIVEFINKAQNKIANLATLLVERGGVHENSLSLLLELSDFIECLDNKYNQWTEDYILKQIHLYNQRANLNAIPFLLLTGLEIEILIGNNGGIGLPIKTIDISDYLLTTTALIKNTNHNTLKNIQPEVGYKGEKNGERYHISREMYDYLYNLMNPTTEPIIDLQITTVGNQSIFEKGLAINNILLQGVVQLNSAKSVTRYAYSRLNRKPTELLTESSSEDIQSYVYREPITDSTTFRFEVDFNGSSSKFIDKTLQFIAPMWYGLSQRNKSAEDIQLLTKVVESPVSAKDFAFTLPNNNTTTNTQQVVVPYLLIPKSRGTVNRIEVETFNTLPDWKVTSVSAILANGNVEPCWLYEFKNTVVGSYVFKVMWI